MDITFESWERIGRNLSLLGNSTAWWLGDWLVFGEEFFPDRYTRAVESTSLAYQTLRNYAWVARAFPLSRRRDKLSLQHHLVVAALPEHEQEDWLTRAERGMWSQRRLRQELRASRQEQWPAESGTTSLVLKVPRESRRRWEEAAGAVGLAVPDWIVQTLDEVAADC